ncbi:probable RNA-directed DNA polymerase from transposon X-element [Aspergillus terreus]|uniref:Probable RNA-directed DNA polymerase from transposon X-element n=1 Tax=Aspergillus terreus TaxID=33178 RepID=A0A8H3MYL4_ASPTE|nr:probable RNA-directed DNA polymerase from transposon X-element [Aspergillus terreus]
MSSSKPGWPPLVSSRGSEKGHQKTLQQRVLDLHQDTSVYLHHLQTYNQGILKPIVELITNTHSIVGEVIKNPLGDDWKKAVADLHEITLVIKKNTTNTQHVLTTQSIPLSSKVRSYAAAAAGAPPPAHTVSSHGSGSSPAATPSELCKDREVIVKLPDAGAVGTFRRLKAVEIKNRAERARVKTSKAAAAATLASVKFVAARQLKSGDLSLSLRTAQEAEIARCHPGWAKSFHQGAVVRLPT